MTTTTNGDEMEANYLRRPWRELSLITWETPFGRERKPINKLSDKELSALVYDRDGITVDQYPSPAEINLILAALEKQ